MSQYECPKCKDIGLIIKEDENGEEVAAKCSCSEQRRIKSIMRSSKITKEFQKLTFGNFEIEDRPQVIVDARNSAFEYYQNFEEIKDERRNSISLLGQPGSGKTHLLMALANNFMKQKGLRVLYFPFIEGFNEMRNNLDKTEEKVHHMQTVDILFIDDLFKGRNAITDFTLEHMNGIVNYRYLNHLPMLVSSEKMIDDLIDIDEALATRIVEMSRDYCVEITGSNRRELNYRLRGIGG